MCVCLYLKWRFYRLRKGRRKGVENREKGRWSIIIFQLKSPLPNSTLDGSRMRSSAPPIVKFGRQSTDENPPRNTRLPILYITDLCKRSPVECTDIDIVSVKISTPDVSLSNKEQNLFETFPTFAIRYNLSFVIVIDWIEIKTMLKIYNRFWKTFTALKSNRMWRIGCSQRLNEN